MTLHKGWCKDIVRAAGIPTADFAVIESVADLERLALALPLLAKPVAEGTGKGVTPRSVIRLRWQFRLLLLELDT
ncbi:MAG: hypothetical protein HC809_12845 [Gammaproteobacteria bacterium]|nr:hypothetical protein [Gammaproteobacteria bacterium]